MRAALGWQPPSRRLLFAPCLILLSRAVAVTGVAEREAGREGGRGREREAGGKKREEEKKSFELRREMEANFDCVQPCGLIQGNI